MLRKLSSHMRGYKWMVILCVLLTICEVLCELVLPLLMARIVDIGIANGDVAYMAKIGFLMVAVAVIAILMGVLNARFSAYTSQGFAARLRSDLYTTTQAFSFSNIDRFSSASLVTRMTTDVTVMQNTLMMCLRILTRAPIMLISAFLIAISINLRLSMVLIGAVVVLVSAFAIFSQFIGQMFTNVQNKLDALNGTVQENLIAIRVVKAFVREHFERQKFKKSNDELAAAYMKAGNLMAMIMPFMFLVLNATTLCVIWFGGHFVGSGIMTTGNLISFISYIMQILMSTMMFAMVVIMLTRARASATRIIEVLDTEPDVTDSPLAIEMEHHIARGKVEFRNVCFHYQHSEAEKGTADGEYIPEDVLIDINFTVQPGEFVGIIGGTGSGKTSLVNLVPRFYDATQGAVLVDDIDVRDYTQRALRDGIGMVMQKNNLFSGTIRDNLLWGNQDATPQEMEQAARDAQAHDFISSFPDGYDTELGQGGVNVSGGQKQRLCIARAMLKKPKILILDDSTSAVDTATEAKIRESFHSNFKDSTVLIVAQRISSVKHADKIIVLDDGRICGVGTHEQLFAENEVYREICNSQNEGSVA